MILKKVKNEIGATAIEYGLIASLVAVVAVSGMSAVGGNLSNTYCTISKHLGGSGTCSGASTGNANGGGDATVVSNSNGVNGTNSIADNPNLTISQIQAGLNDVLDLNNVPHTLGGYDYPISSLSDAALNNKLIDVSNISNSLSRINTTDPITNVFGVYDKDNNYQPITDYHSVNDALQKGGGSIAIGSSYSMSSGSDIMQITTAHGKAYTISPNGVASENTSKSANTMTPQTQTYAPMPQTPYSPY